MFAEPFLPAKTEEFVKNSTLLLKPNVDGTFLKDAFPK